uniref:KIN17-like protein n=1 Tax=Lygus hesperus TaxID=30085 RepID=A0A0A9X568_LYGHE
MCGKQCRDENGFQNHSRSESHLQQMMIFLEHSGSIVDEKSKEFEKAYMDLVRRYAATVRRNANQLYQEIVADRTHIHLNATKWASFTDFIQYLGHTKKAEIEYKEGEGWFIKYIPRDANTLQRDRKAEIYRKMMDESERKQEQVLQQQLQQLRQQDSQSPTYQQTLQAVLPTTVDPTKRDKKLSFSLKSSHPHSSVLLTKAKASSNLQEKSSFPPSIVTAGTASSAAKRQRVAGTHPTT